MFGISLAEVVLIFIIMIVFIRPNDLPIPPLLNCKKVEKST